MHSSIRFVWIAVFLASVLSCKKNASSPSKNDDFEYFPDKAGQFIIYDVDSIVHNDFTGKVDSFRFQLKELVESIYTDNQGRPTQRIERYKRKNANFEWTLTDVWWANRTSTGAEKVEENVRFIKLIFPVAKDGSWNGNAQNTLGNWDYTYSAVHTPVNFFSLSSNLSFDSTVTVVQKNDENLIQKKFYTEIYAKKVGLIFKQIIDVESQNVASGKPIMERIEKGLEFKMVVKSYGKQ